jgi:hypothetical protein
MIVLFRFDKSQELSIEINEQVIFAPITDLHLLHKQFSIVLMLMAI